MARRDVRTAIVDAAEALAVERGFTGVTTKEVARAAACSEGSIYNHFRDRSDLLAQVVANRVLAVVDDISHGPLDVGPDGSLTTLVAAVGDAYVQLIALSTSLFADPEVLGRFNAVLQERGASPDGIRDAVTAQLQRAQEAGTVRGDVDAGAVGLLITGACHEVALHSYLSGHGPHLPPAVAATVADTLRALLAPAPKR